jgi:hypothetical protein
MTTSAAWPFTIALMSSWTIGAVIGRIGQPLLPVGDPPLISTVNF